MADLEMAGSNPFFAAVQRCGLIKGQNTMPDIDRDKGWDGSLAALAEVLGYRFVHPQLLAEALTHRSFIQTGDGRFDYERLEFLGDRVLGLVIADFLMDMFPDDAEGQLARRFTGLVRREALESVAANLDLGRFLRLSDSEEHNGGRDNPGLQADACEAVIGALYLDGGLDAARLFIIEKWRPLIGRAGTPARDAKTRLQEWAQARKRPLPAYTVVDESGPPHEPIFTIEVTVDGLAPVRATAGSKRHAEQDAAARLLEQIDADNDGQFQNKGED
jgi:ribonuclease-3